MGAAAELSPEELDRLEALAARVGRPAEALRREAIERYVEDEIAVLESLERSRADFEAGRVVENDEVIAWLETWGTGRDARRPKITAHQTREEQP